MRRGDAQLIGGSPHLSSGGTGAPEVPRWRCVGVEVCRWESAPCHRSHLSRGGVTLCPQRHVGRDRPLTNLSALVRGVRSEVVEE